jgi:hypothetical protein
VRFSDLYGQKHRLFVPGRDDEVMKAITVLFPYPWLLALNKKPHETRPWNFPSNYRGPLAIHVSKSRKPWHMNLSHEEPFYSALEALHGDAILNNGKCSILTPGMGCIIAVCELADVLRIEEGGLYQRVKLPGMVSGSEEMEVRIAPLPGEPERSFGDYSSGRKALVLQSMRVLETPVPCRGQQGLWNVPEEIEEMIKIA